MTEVLKIGAAMKILTNERYVELHLKIPKAQIGFIT